MENLTTSLIPRGINDGIFPGFSLPGAKAKALSLLFPSPPMKLQVISFPFLLPVRPELDRRVWYNNRRKNQEGSLYLVHVNPARGPAPTSHPDQMLIKHRLPRSKAGDTGSKSTKWRVMAAYQNNNKKHEKFSKSRRKNP